MRQSILGIALLGTLLCMALLTMSYLRPVTLENWARDAIAAELTSNVGQAVGKLDDSAITRRAEQLMGKNKQAIEQARDRLQRELSGHIDATIQRMLDPACPCRAAWRAAGQDVLRHEGERLSTMNVRLGALVESKYREVAGALLREIGIFSAANGAVFLLLALLAWRWKRATLQLLAPAAILLGAIVGVAGIYLFSQNWLQTILLGDYVGFMYLPYLASAAAFMSDIVFNRARLGTQLINAILILIGSTAAAVVC